MALYARSDLMSVSVPASSGGCDRTHSRPVRSGSPDRAWRLDCPPCESYLRGSNKPPVLKYTPGDLKAGIPPRQERVADADPHWSSTPESVPLTPDEQSVSAIRAERGALQLQMMQALAAIRATGVNVPPEAMWLLERDLPAGILKGTMVCANGHDNTAGARFCAECGISMAEQQALPEGTAAGIPMTSLHVATLRKMCRQNGLPDKGSKNELIARLRAFPGEAA